MSAIGERRGGSAGFTLIELLVTLAITALAAGLVFPAMDRISRRERLATGNVLAEEALRAARADALRLSRGIRVAAAADGRGLNYGPPPPAGAVLPEVRVSQGGISFFADGSSSGGEVRLSDGGERRRLIVLAPSGAIRRER